MSKLVLRVGRDNTQLHVLALGYSEPLPCRNSSDGFGSRPHGGMLRSPVAKNRMLSNDTDCEEAAHNTNDSGNHCKMKQATCQVK